MVLVRRVDLRHLLLDELLRARGSDRSIADLVGALRAGGFVVAGHPAKTVSDALRTELTRGRAVRVARGRYAVGLIPRTTRWRLGPRVAELRRLGRTGPG